MIKEFKLHFNGHTIKGECEFEEEEFNGMSEEKRKEYIHNEIFHLVKEQIEIEIDDEY